MKIQDRSSDRTIQRDDYIQKITELDSIVTAVTESIISFRRCLRSRIWIQDAFRKHFKETMQASDEEGYFIFDMFLSVVKTARGRLESGLLPSIACNS